jgi:hypothetical protein
MKGQIKLVEDTCLGKGLDFNTEKTELLRKGNIIVKEYTHPAVGRICIFNVL